jgi:hypothetical protein
MATAKASYKIESWDEGDIDTFPDGSKIARSRATQTFSGDITGSSITVSTLFYRPDGTSDYVTIERLDGAIHGKVGTVAMRYTGTYDLKLAKATFEVIPGSGTGDLEGVTGSGTFQADHDMNVSYELDYAFGV